jgi:hypothetical protein
MTAAAGEGYQSWFISARDPVAPRALWIRHTSLRPRGGAASAALWCTVVDRGISPRPAVVKQVTGAHPDGAVAGPARFSASAAMGHLEARWELSVSASAAPLRPLRPAVLYRAPVPRTKLEVAVPDALISGSVDINGNHVAVSGWRGTVGHNWGSEHADTWVWLHADTLGEPDGWLDVVLARVRVGGVRSPWLAMGALQLGRELIPVGGLGRRARIAAEPGRLSARVPSPGAVVELGVATADEDAVAVSYADPSGGSRLVRHAALATVDVTVHRRGRPATTLTSTRGAYEYGTSQGLGEVDIENLPAG